MTAGNTFDPLLITAKTPQAEFAGYAAQLRDASGAATGMGIAQQEVTGKLLQFQTAAERSTVVQAAMLKATQENTVALHALTASHIKHNAVTGEMTGTHEKALQSFSHMKLEMREMAHVGEHLTGVHTGLSGVIRLALNPQMLALGVIALVVGKALEAHKKHEEMVAKAVEESTKWVQNYTKALDENKSKLMTFSEFQEKIIKGGHALAAINLADQILKEKDAIAEHNTKAAEMAHHLETLEKLHKSGKMSQEMYDEKMAQITLDTKKAAVEAANATLHLQALTEAQRLGFLTLEEYEASLKHWADIAQKASDIVKNIKPYLQELAVETAKLSEEYRKGAIDIFEFNKRLADLAVIANSAAIKDMAKDGKAYESALAKKTAAHEKFLELMNKDEHSAASKINEASMKQLAEFKAMLKAKEISQKDFKTASVKIEQDRVSALIALFKKEKDDEWKVDQAQQKRVKEADDKYNKTLKKDAENTLKFKQQIADRELLMNKKGHAKIEAELEIHARKEHDELEKMWGNEITDYEVFCQMWNEITSRYMAQDLAIKKDFAQQETDALLQSSSAAISAIFGNTKAAAYANAMIHLFQGISKIWGTWGDYPPVAVALTVLESATVGAEISKINSASPPQTQGHAKQGMEMQDRSYLINAHAGEHHVIYPNTSHLMSISSAITRLAGLSGGRGGGGGGDTFHFNAPIHSTREGAMQIATETARIARRRNVSARAA